MIDSHCHLVDEAFATDLEATVGRAVAAGLTGALCIIDAGNAQERSRAGALAALWTEVRFGVGVHPHQAGQWTGRYEDARQVVRATFDDLPAARAVGETGLDYHYDFAPRSVQRELFAAQVSLAVEKDVPVVVHAREADDDALAVLRDAGKGQVRGVMHCFTGDRAFARRALDLGLHISLAGIVTFPKADELREVARFVPEDRLLAETDCPYLAPIPHRGNRNEPAWVTRVGECLAELRGVPVAAMTARIVATYQELFRP